MNDANKASTSSKSTKKKETSTSKSSSSKKEDTKGDVQDIDKQIIREERCH